MPYKPRQKQTKPANRLLKLNPEEPPSAYWYMLGKVENYRVVPGFSQRGQQYLFIDKNRDVLVPLARILGLDEGTAIEEFYTTGRFYGVNMTPEEEVELWMTIYPDFQSIYFKQRIERWLAHPPAQREAPDRKGHRF